MILKKILKKLWELTDRHSRGGEIITALFCYRLYLSLTINSNDYSNRESLDNIIPAKAEEITRMGLLMYDVLIIGSGPAGLSAAIYARRANIKAAVIEKEYEGTGQIAESQRVDNYLGLPKTSGYDLGEIFRNHAVDMGVEFIEQEVTAIEQTLSIETGDKETPVWKVTDDSGNGQLAKAIILATGASPRLLDAPGEKDFLGKGISFCAICDGAFYKGKRVAVIGGGDTALDDALYLADIAEQVYLVHRRMQFRGAEATVEAIKKKKNIDLLLETQVEAFLGEKKLSGIQLSNGEILEVDGAFVAIGSTPQSNLVRDLVDVSQQGYILADESGITKAAGLFAAGDVREKKLRQVVTAVSDGANAATSAAEYLKRV